MGLALWETEQRFLSPFSGRVLRYNGEEEVFSMTPLPGPDSWNVELLLEAVEQLSPAEQREFQRRLASRQAADGSPDPKEAKLIQAAQARLPAAAERRLRRLIARSERGRLTPKELANYQALAQEAQRIDAARVDALAKLSRLQGRSIRAVKAALDREGRTDDA